jgi:hypothetical protein
VLVISSFPVTRRFLFFVLLFSGQHKVLVGVRKDMATHQEDVDAVLTTANFVYQIVKIAINRRFLSYEFLRIRFLFLIYFFFHSMHSIDASSVMCIYPSISIQDYFLQEATFFVYHCFMILLITVHMFS